MTWGRGEGDKHMNFTCIFVDWRFLDVMGIDIVEGRNFKKGDGDMYIFNESAKKQYPWLATDQPITDGDYPVVGFCKDIKYATLRVDDSQQPIAFFVPSPNGRYWSNGSWRNVLMVRVAKGMDKREAKQKVMEVVNKYEKGQPLDISGLRYMDVELEKAYKQEGRFTKQILLFSLLAILISIIGVFGMTMFESDDHVQQALPVYPAGLLRGGGSHRLHAGCTLARRLCRPHRHIAPVILGVLPAYRPYHDTDGDIPKLEECQRESRQQH